MRIGFPCATIVILSLIHCESKSLQKRNLDQAADGIADDNQQNPTLDPEISGGSLAGLGLFTDGGNQSVVGIEPGLLDYENQTYVGKLEQITDEEDVQSPADLPGNVYEVNFKDWTEDTSASGAGERDEAEDRLTHLMRETLLTVGGSHRIRHSSSRIVRRDLRDRPMGDEPVINLPVTNREGRSSGPLSRLIEQETFNMTVDYQQPFHNVERPKLLEIVLLMRSDCTLLPKRIVRWVSGRRGILFECQNGAWVVKYLKRRRRKPRPVSIRDCHEIHADGQLGDLTTQHQVVIKYNDKERKTFDVFCQHDPRHSNHQLIDNHISTEPYDLSNKKEKQAGAWTVIQRRENGQVKFYRSMKKYKTGFGRLDRGEYWLGLEPLHEITQIRPYMLRVEITTKDNETFFSEYKQIRVASETKHYRLRLGDFVHPTPEQRDLSAGDFMSLHNRGKFHARDSDDVPVNCAKLYGTAFWFRGCWTAVNLNGPYHTNDRRNRGVRWATANPDDIRRVWRVAMLIKPIL